MLQNPGESLRNWYSYFFHCMGAFLQADSHPVISFITWEMLRFPHRLPIALENAVKCIEFREPGKLVPFFSPRCVYLFPSDSHPMACSTPWKMHGFSHHFPIASIPDTLELKAKYIKRRRGHGCYSSKKRNKNIHFAKVYHPTQNLPYF